MFCKMYAECNKSHIKSRLCESVLLKTQKFNRWTYQLWTYSQLHLRSFKDHHWVPRERLCDEVLNGSWSIVLKYLSLFNKKRRKIFLDYAANRAMVFSIRETSKINKNPKPNKKKYYCIDYKINGHSLERCYKANLNIIVCSNCNVSGHTAKTCYRGKN